MYNICCCYSVSIVGMNDNREVLAYRSQCQLRFEDTVCEFLSAQSHFDLSYGQM